MHPFYSEASRTGTLPYWKSSSPPLLRKAEYVSSIQTSLSVPYLPCTPSSSSVKLRRQPLLLLYTYQPRSVFSSSCFSPPSPARCSVKGGHLSPAPKLWGCYQWRCQSPESGSNRPSAPAIVHWIDTLVRWERTATSRGCSSHTPRKSARKGTLCLFLALFLVVKGRLIGASCSTTRYWNRQAPLRWRNSRRVCSD